MYFSVFGFNVESAFGSRQFLLSSAAVGAEARVNGDCVEGREPFNPLEGAIGGVDTLQLSGSFDIIPGRQTLDTGFSGIVGDGHIEVNWAFETRFPPDQETESR
jgi:hypothetical protein